MRPPTRQMPPRTTFMAAPLQPMATPVTGIDPPIFLIGP